MSKAIDKFLIYNTPNKDYRTVLLEGTRQFSRELEYYNLDAIISVGYRLNSRKEKKRKEKKRKAIQFIVRAIQTLKEFILKDL
jgi:hypothetical protein